MTLFFVHIQNKEEEQTVLSTHIRNKIHFNGCCYCFIIYYYIIIDNVHFVDVHSLSSSRKDTFFSVYISYAAVTLKHEDMNE